MLLPIGEPESQRGRDAAQARFSISKSSGRNRRVEFLWALTNGWGRSILSIAFGAASGYVYCRLVGCRTGACPLTSNPWISSLYGALIGALIAH